eukprot:29575-Hanusia_phi.AAC.1
MMCFGSLSGRVKSLVPCGADGTAASKETTEMDDPAFSSASQQEVSGDPLFRRSGVGLSGGAAGVMRPRRRRDAASAAVRSSGGRQDHRMAVGWDGRAAFAE